MNQQQLFKSGKSLGIPVSVIKFAVANIKECYPLLQAMADHDAQMRGSCGSKPPPRFDPGYYYCDGSTWRWVEGG